MKIIISHDVDHLKPSDNLRTLIIPKAIIRAGIEMSIGTISFREFNLRLKNLIKNKWQNINGLMKYDLEQGVKSTYFIGVNNGLGLNYSIKDATYWIKRILKKGFDVGVHGIDYDSYDAIKKEYDIFKEISGLDTFGIRMHYLRSDKKTFDYMAKSGYIFDASIYGMKKSYLIEQMHEFPLHIMDGYEIETNRQWQTIKVEQAIKNTIIKIEKAKERNIEYLSILLHPKYFDDSFLTWQIWYKSIIEYCNLKEYPFINYRAAIREIENNQQQINQDSNSTVTQQLDRPKLKICHISTVHQRQDVRIFFKECISLSKHYEVHLIIADGKGDEIKRGVHIHDIGERQSVRVNRVRIDAKKAFRKAKDLDCESYHIHDPELIIIAGKLKKLGNKVIYDVHEDLPRQIYGKPYLTRLIKPIASRSIEIIENRFAKKMDYILTATPFIYKRFLKINKNTTDINNFPLISENLVPKDFYKKEDCISYVGGIFENRGVYELIESLQYSKVKLHLAGDFENDTFMEKCKSSVGWEYVRYYGFVSREEVADILNKSKIGIVSLYPLRNYLDSLPIKMFEYMLAEIPVIASDFPYWKKIVNENQCGLNVNPKDAKAIAEKILYLIHNPETALKMGKNGRKAILDNYNWCHEESKLIDVYQKIINN